MAINSLSTGFRPGVCTSSTRPTAPYEGQQIYETDTDKTLVWTGSAWYANWNLPWGLVALTKTNNTNFSVTTTEAVSITSSSFTAVANRYYKVTYVEAIVYSSGTTAMVGATKLDTISGTLLSQTYTNTNATASSNIITTGLFTTTAGSHVVVGTLDMDSGTGTGYRVNLGASIFVEDVGPV